MKTLTLTLCGLLAAGTLSVPCQAAPHPSATTAWSAPSPTFTDEEPAGERRIYLRSGQACAYDEMAGYVFEYAQYGAYNLVLGEGQSVWIQNILCGVNSDKWVEGTLSPDGTTVTVAAGTIIERNDKVRVPDSEQFYEGNLRLYMLKGRAHDGSIQFTPDAEAPITFTLSGDRFILNGTKDEEAILGAIYTDFEGKAATLNGTWTKMGEWDSQATLFGESAATLPDGLTTRDYLLTAGTSSDNAQQRLVQLATSGTDAYLGSLTSQLPHAWVKGTVHDGKITFPRQFIGTVNSFLTYFSGGTANREGQGEYTEDFTFLYDAESGTLTPENTHESLFITTFDYGNFNIFASPVLTPYEEVAATPVAPEIYDVSPSANLPGTLEILYDVTNCDSEGHYLNPDKFSYVLYVNGQPYTFTAGPYRLQADRQELSLGFQNKYFTVHFGCLGLFLQEKGVRTIGLQSIYRGGGEKRRSALVSFSVPEEVGILAPTATAAVTMPLFNLYGQPATGSTRGIVVSQGKKTLTR